jgi:hypothetical protein
VVLTSEVTPPQTNGWKVTVAGILLLLLMASCVQLSLVANITKLPKVTAVHKSICLTAQIIVYGKAANGCVWLAG